ncbi:MAG: hypothetical protein GXO22_04580 [Aquificae bacterium]|nr:hypothetical protein [Aquificota bacterium]
MYLLIILSVLSILFTSTAKTDKFLEDFLLSINQIEVDLLLYKKIKNHHLISIGKNHRIYSFVLKNGKIVVKNSGYIPNIKNGIIHIGNIVYDYRKGSILQKEESKDSIFSIEQKDGRWYLFLQKNSKKKLRFKTRYQPVLLEDSKEPFLIVPKPNKLEIYYIKPPKFYPKIIKRIPLFNGYSYEIFPCERFLYILEISQKNKNAFLFIIDTVSKKLTKKLKIKDWQYKIAGCGTNGIVLSGLNTFYILSSKGDVKPAPKIKVLKNLPKPKITPLDVGKIQNIFFLKDFLAIKGENQIKLYDANFSFIKSYPFSLKAKLYQIQDQIYALYEQKNKVCLFSFENDHKFCKRISSKTYYKLSNYGLFILEKGIFYRYDFNGDLVLKDKLPLSAQKVELTKFGVFYIDESLVHLKPDGDFEIYEIKPISIREIGEYVLFKTEEGNYFFNGKKLIYLGKYCEPFSNFRLCDEGFFNLYTIYPKKQKYSFLQRPICDIGRFFVFFENPESNNLIKFFSKEKNRLKSFISLPSEENSFRCWKNSLIRIHPSKLEIVTP